MRIKLQTWIYAVDDAACRFGNLCILLNMVFVVFNVIMRGIVNKPIAGFTDISGMISCLIIVMTIAYTEKEDSHISVDFIVAYLPSRLRGALRTTMGLLNAAITGVLGVWFFDYALTSYRSGAVTMTAKIPFWPLIFSCAIGMVLLSLTILVKTMVPPPPKEGEKI